jgi:hypothetical protein
MVSIRIAPWVSSCGQGLARPLETRQRLLNALLGHKSQTNHQLVTFVRAVEHRDIGIIGALRVKIGTGKSVDYPLDSRP